MIPEYLYNVLIQNAGILCIYDVMVTDWYSNCLFYCASNVNTRLQNLPEAGIVTLTVYTRMLHLQSIPVCYTYTLYLYVTLTVYTRM